MTTILDIPQSGVYIQQGAIFQLVAQIIDYTTGLPVQLQTATGLSIAVLYPDGVTAQTFSASLYTDGSDGMIVYTTVNTGMTIDLSQVGLYHFQGNAVVGGVQLPPSYADDFYVLPNVMGSAPSSIYNPSAIILFDASNVRWAGTIQSGALVWTATAMGPVTYLQPTSLVMKDDTGVYWTVTINTLGVVSAVPGGTFTHALNYFLLSDINGKTWVVTISEQGQLVPS